MNKRELGNTGIIVSEIAFGGVEIGMPYGFGVNTKTDMLSRENAIKLLHEALDNGINFFDTARLYGDSESIMGEAFEGRRNEVVLSTKCKHFVNAEGNIPGYDELKKLVEDSLEESLVFLRTDHVDVFMLHQADLEILNNRDIKKVFKAIKESGKTRAIGASTYTVEETVSAINNGWDVVQLPFNLLDQKQSACFEIASQKGVAIIVRSVLMKGLLSDRGLSLHPALAEVENHIKKYKQLLSEETSHLSNLATKFALSFNQISSILIGIDKLEYLYSALECVNGEALDHAVVKQAKDLAYPDPVFLNLHEWSVNGWLK